MEKIQFDSGIKSYRLGEGVLRFNPGDPNVYARFLEAVEQIRQLEKELTGKADTVEGDGGKVVALMQEADGKIKKILDEVFGCGNDFHKLLGGVNLLAVASNGQRVITNLFAALEPVLVAGAQSCAEAKAAEAVNKANKRREESGK